MVRPRAQGTTLATILLIAGLLGGCDGCSSNRQTEQIEPDSSPPAAVSRSPTPRNLTVDAAADEKSTPDTRDRTAEQPDASPTHDTTPVDDAGPENSASDTDDAPLFTARVSENSVTLDLHGFYPYPRGDRPPNDSELKVGGEYRQQDVRSPYDNLHRFDVLTTDGVVTLEMTHIRQYTCGGEGMKTCYEFVADDPPENFATDSYTTLVGPEHSFPDEATIQPPDADEPSTDVRDTFLSSLLDEVTPGERALLEDNSLDTLRAELSGDEPSDPRSLNDWKPGDGTIQDATCKITEGTFPAPHARLMTMNGPDGTDMLGLSFPMYRAVAMVANSGEITEWVKFSYGQRLALGHVDRAGVEIRGLIDTSPDDDTLDGVLMSYDGEDIWLDISTDRVTADTLKH